MKAISFARLAAALAAALIGVNATAATSVYSQAPNAVFQDVSAVADFPADPGFTWTLDQDEQAWAYFSIPKSISFDRVGWYGSNADGKFAVNMFAASCFSCGANQVQTDGTFVNSLLPNNGAYDLAQVHKTQVSGNLYSYYINLPSQVTLGTGSAYAISVVNNYSALPFLWAGSDTGSGVHLHFVIGQAMFLRSPGNLAFSLSQTTVSPVPEPATYLMLCAGLILVFGIARKRKAFAIA
jgi:PEP-CTERM motif